MASHEATGVRHAAITKDKIMSITNNVKLSVSILLNNDRLNVVVLSDFLQLLRNHPILKENRRKKAVNQNKTIFVWFKSNPVIRNNHTTIVDARKPKI